MFGKLGKALSNHGDGYDTQRATLKVALESFRERVGQLITFIPRDMPGYTVHDLTHLDALWEMADIIVGTDYDLNPAEAFVLGGAILLHDAGMTVAAYLDQGQELERTVEYSTALASAKVQLSGEQLEASTLEARAKEIALVETLRALHPKKAEELATQEWKSKHDGKSLFLIGDDDLRGHYGSLIGRIANSHHWDHARLQKDLQASLGAAPNLPADWAVDPLKIALILRCADASHLDARRAPRLLFTVGRVSGASADHWKFQGLISKPVVSNGKLQYASTSDFDIEKSEAWQLAFDTLQMVDGELRAAAEINIQRKYPKFAVDGVLGAAAPEQMSKYIRVVGWKPVTLNLRVSNVPHLARTLGGKDLYSFGLAPLRELLQNAADSVEARVAIDQDFDISQGKISVVVMDDGREDVTLEILDNGVGMSERVLTGPLLDFGFSFWKSAEARREFPGLQNDQLSPRGRFGIGFFSIFMWSSEVEVFSRVYSASLEETNVLHFREGLDARPLLRDALPAERTMAWSTRIRLRIPRSIAAGVMREPRGEYHFSVDGAYLRRRPFFNSWASAVQLLVATLPIVVEVKIDGSRKIVSMPEWRSVSAVEFIDFFHEIAFRSDDAIYQKFVGSLTDLHMDGRIVGRGLVLPNNNDFREALGVVVYDRGIFAGVVTGGFSVGVLEGKVTNAAREKFESHSFWKNGAWLKLASERAFALCSHEGEQLAIQRSLISMGYLAESRPLLICDRKVISLAGLLEKLSITGRVWFRLDLLRDDDFGLKATESLTPIYGLRVDPDRVYALVDLPGEFSRSDTPAGFITRDGSMLGRVFKQIVAVIGQDCDMQSNVVERDYGKDYVDITFSRM